MKRALLLTILIVAFCFTASAQTPDADRQAAEISRIQLVNALERAQREVRASRQMVDALKQQIETKEQIIKAEQRKVEMSASAIAGLQSEVKNLRSALAEGEKAIELQKTAIAELKTDLDKTRRKLKRARTFAKYLTVAAGVLAAIVVIK